MAEPLADQMVDLSRKVLLISFFTNTRAKKSAGRRGIPPHTPPAAHALSTRRSAAGGEDAMKNEIMVLDFQQKKFELYPKNSTTASRNEKPALVMNAGC